jgi:ectoine hydroxylase-related dioxygenase (phytanoyl-CoA dioxygenase family)
MTSSDQDWEISPIPTTDQVDFYHKNGYLKFGRIFTKRELDTLRDYVDHMIANLPQEIRSEQMDVPHFANPSLFRYLTHPAVLDVIECFIGPDIVLWSSHFISKRSGDGLAVPWHQDGAYWGSRLQPMQVVTMWLAVDASTVDNGCMRVIAGSHQQKYLRYEDVDRQEHLFGREIVNEDLNRSEGIDLELEVGECHFHDAFTAHGSNPNRSGKRRCGYTMRYMPADVEHHFDSSWNRQHHIYLLRGQDQTNGFNTYKTVPDF